MLSNGFKFHLVIQGWWRNFPMRANPKRLKLKIGPNGLLYACSSFGSRVELWKFDILSFKLHKMALFLHK